MVAPVTSKLYVRAQSDFIDWCRFHKIRQPAPLDQVAAYLWFVLRNNGAPSVLVRTSAIAKFYRDADRSFDTKHSAIQEVLIEARKRVRLNRPDR